MNKDKGELNRKNVLLVLWDGSAKFDKNLLWTSYGVYSKENFILAKILAFCASGNGDSLTSLKRFGSGLSGLPDHLAIN